MRVTRMLSLILFVAVSTATLAAERPRIVSFDTDIAPGTFDEFHDYTAPTINNRGHVAFGGRAGQTVGVWKETDTGLEMAYRNEQNVGPATVGYFEVTPNLNDRGEVAQTVEDARAGHQAILATTGGRPLTSLGVTGESVPAGPSTGAKHWRIMETRLNEPGEVVSRSSMQDAGYSSGSRAIFRYGPDGSSSTVASTGESFAGPLGEATFADLYAPQLNSEGQVLFGAQLRGENYDSSNNSSLWMDDASGRRMIVRETDQVQGMRRGIEHGDVWGSSLNGRGETAFVSSLTQSGNNLGLTWDNDSAIFREHNGTFGMVVQEGDQAAGLESGRVYHTFGGTMLGTSGDLLFSAETLGGNQDYRDAVFVAGEAGVDVLVADGMAAAGVGPGATFDVMDQSEPRLLGGIAMNAHGDIAYSGDFNRANGPDGVGLWLTNEYGELEVIAYTGGILEVEPGEFREIATLEFLGGAGDDAGMSTGLNDCGEVTYYASFIDGSSGIFVSGVTVPEPTALGLLSVIAGVAGCGRRRRFFAS